MNVQLNVCGHVPQYKKKRLVRSHWASVGILMHRVYLSKIVLITLKNKIQFFMFWNRIHVSVRVSAICILVARQILFYLCIFNTFKQMVVLCFSV